jgi:hypothetical protein
MAITYKVPTRRRAAKPLFDKLPREGKPEEEPIGLIQGQVPDSKEEWWISLALDRLKLSYTYQYPVNGGRQRGGKLIDFVVHTVPLMTMVEPEGNYWHTGEIGSDDKKRDADVEEAMRDICKTPILKLWIPDLTDRETVFQRIAREFS